MKVNPNIRVSNAMTADQDGIVIVLLSLDKLLQQPSIGSNLKDGAHEEVQVRDRKY